MLVSSRFSRVLIAAGFLLFGFAGTVRGQCLATSIGFDSIGDLPENPFRAERVTHRTASADSVVQMHQFPPETIARDRQGRVRLERTTGEVKMKSETGTESTMLGRIILICDPVAQTLTQLNTLLKTAIIHRAKESAAPNPARPHRSICGAFIKSGGNASPQSEDLGHRTIEGVEAAGARRTFVSEGYFGRGSAVSTPKAEEIWCSDELDAVLVRILTNTETGASSEARLTKIERVEPDPALFQIPSDYTASEAGPLPAVAAGSHGGGPPSE